MSSSEDDAPPSVPHAGAPEDASDEEEAGEAAPGGEAGRPRAVLSAKKLAKQQERYDKRGMVYLSRVPPFMKPAKLRHLLAQHGEVLRIYLAAEGAAHASASARRAVAG